MRRIALAALVYLLLTGINPVWAQYKIKRNLWKLVAEEQFNQPVDSLKKNWDFYYTWGQSQGPTDSTYFRPYTSPENLRTTYSLLELYTKHLDNPLRSNEGHIYDYTNGLIRSTHDDFPGLNPENDPKAGGYLYGMFEISCQFPKAKGQFPAFWLCGNNMWPPEVDIFEYYNAPNSQRFSCSAHWNNPDYFALPDSLKKTTNMPRNLQVSDDYYKFYDLTAEFHTFTLIWTPTRLSWFYDGQEIKTDSIPDHVPGHVATAINDEAIKGLCTWQKMDAIINSGLNYPPQGDTTINQDPFLVDYVRIYKPATLPEYTGGDLSSYYRDQLLPAYNAISTAERKKKKN